MASILEEEISRGTFSGVMHCFSSGAELAERAMAVGFYISFSGILTFNKSTDLQTIAAKISLNRLLVETDHLIWRQRRIGVKLTSRRSPHPRKISRNPQLAYGPDGGYNAPKYCQIIL